MAVNYITYNTDLTLAEFFAAIVDAAEFWDSTTSTTAVVGGLTMTLGSSYITVSGYTYTSQNIGGSSTVKAVRIAATDDALLIGYSTQTGAAEPLNFFAFGKNADNEWGFLYGGGTYNNITELIADGLTSKSYRPTNNNLQAQQSTINTQLIDITAAYGDFTFTDILFIALSPSLTYTGKMQLDSGEKFVQMHCFALKYTD